MSHYSLSDLVTPELVIDDIGTLFFYKGRVLRAINAKHIDLIRYLFDSGFMPELIENQMFPDSWICTDTIEGYHLVVEHKKIAPWNYPYEWSFTMFKDAAVMVLELTKIANEYNLCVVDGHYYNVTFDKCLPVYIDLGSFRKQGDTHHGWVGFSDFHHSFFAPLHLWTKGLYSVSRNASLGKTLFEQKEFITINNPLLPNSIINLVNYFTTIKHRILETPQKEALEKLTNNKIKKWSYLLVSYYLHKTVNLNTFIKKIEKLVPPKKTTMWTHYHTGRDLSEEKRFQRIISIIKSLENCKSVVEVAANHGKLSLAIAEQTQITDIISTDYDETAVDTMYLLSKSTNSISPLVINASLPNGRIGDLKVSKRIKSDIAIGLAITHHLLLSQGFPIQAVLRQFKEIAHKYVIIEFMPLGLFGGDLKKTPPLPDYYTTTWFRDAFSAVFELIIDEKLEENRHVFVGKMIPLRKAHHA